MSGIDGVQAQSPKARRFLWYLRSRGGVPISFEISCSLGTPPPNVLFWGWSSLLPSSWLADDDTKPINTIQKPDINCDYPTLTIMYNHVRLYVNKRWNSPNACCTQPILLRSVPRKQLLLICYLSIAPREKKMFTMTRLHLHLKNISEVVCTWTLCCYHLL